MCDTCKSEKCCCPEKRVSVSGKKGENGKNGRNAYIYRAYASDVTPGSPDIVTGFSLTDGSLCWMAVITSIIPLTPTETDFQGNWFNRCSDIPPCVCDITAGGSSGNNDQQIASTSYTAITGLATGVLAAGTYLFWGEIGGGIGPTTLVEYSFADGVGAVGISRKVGYFGGENNQEGQNMCINEPLVFAAPTAIHLVLKVSVGGSFTVLKRSILYLKIS